jgi:hypothetical protein
MDDWRHTARQEPVTGWWERRWTLRSGVTLWARAGRYALSDPSETLDDPTGYARWEIEARNSGGRLPLADLPGLTMRTARRLENAVGEIEPCMRWQVVAEIVEEIGEEE